VSHDHFDVRGLLKARGDERYGLHARYGKGHYTYFAYAFHRQLPYGVPGAYRLFANLLAPPAATATPAP